MELNVNSPAYFTEQYGIDNEVYKFLKNVRIYFSDKEYSDTLHIIGITPVAAPQELYDSGKWKECVRFVGDKSCAMIFIRMNFEEYYNADSSQKINLTKELILEAVKRIKSKVSFNYEVFEKDFNQLEATLQF